MYTIWARDKTDPLETGKAPGTQVYGSHPFYMFKSDNSVWAGVYTNIAAASDWYIKTLGTKGQVGGAIDLKMVAVGGVTDIYVIIGSTPGEIVGNYWEYIIGKPVLVPVFALGWH